MVDGDFVIGFLVSVIGALITVLIAVLAWQWKRQVQRIDGMAQRDEVKETLRLIEKHIDEDKVEFKRLYQRSDTLNDAIHATNQAVTSLAATVAAQRVAGGQS